MTDIHIAGVQLLDASGTALAVFQAAGPITVRLRYQASRPVVTPHFAVDVYRAADGDYCTGLNTRLDRRSFGTLEGDGHVDLVIDSRGLRPGAYVLSVGILEARSCRTLDVHHRAYQFSIATQTNAHGPAVFGRDWHDRQRATDRLAIKKELSQ
jgi:hypothetical protein